MLRAALLRRSCDGVAAATESLLRRSRCCDGDAQTSSVALILRVASRRDALNEEPASFPPGDSNFNSWPTVLGHPPGPVIFFSSNKTPPLLTLSLRECFGASKKTLGGKLNSSRLRTLNVSVLPYTCTMSGDGAMMQNKRLFMDFIEQASGLPAQLLHAPSSRSQEQRPPPPPEQPPHPCPLCRLCAPPVSGRLGPRARLHLALRLPLTCSALSLPRRLATQRRSSSSSTRSSTASRRA